MLTRTIHTHTRTQTFLLRRLAQDVHLLEPHSLPEILIRIERLHAPPPLRPPPPPKRQGTGPLSVHQALATALMESLKTSASRASMAVSAAARAATDACSARAAAVAAASAASA